MTKVPMPFTQRWLEFRLVHLPVVTFLILFAATLFIWKHYVTPTPIVAPGVEGGGLETANLVTDASEVGR